MAQGEDVPMSDFGHSYSASEVNDITAVLRHLSVCQDLLLEVNQQYIYSAAQDDAYRTEPRFQLQGSYRNMNKLAEKIVPAMNEEELGRVIKDHYVGEAQTLTTGAEQNLLKLGDMRGTLTADEQARWEQIKADFRRMKRLGGSEDDPAVRVVSQLGDINDRLAGLRDDIGAATAAAAKPRGPTPAEESLATMVGKLDTAIEALSNPSLAVSVEQQQPQGMTDLLDQQIDLVEGILQLVHRMTQSLESGETLRIQLLAAVNDLKEMDERLKQLTPADLRRAQATAAPPQGQQAPPSQPRAKPPQPQAQPSQPQAKPAQQQAQPSRRQAQPAQQQPQPARPQAQPAQQRPRQAAPVAPRREPEDRDEGRTTQPGMPSRKSPFPKSKK